MVLTALIKRQLRVFAVLATGALLLTIFVYGRVPALLGVGVYDVSVDFGDSSGLYPKALVTYRGVKVGQVSALEVNPSGGAVATLRIDDDVEIPADAVAELHSTSAIGEQYVDLVAEDGDGPFLEDGSDIPRERSVEMPQITPVLDSLNELLASVPLPQTRRVLDQVDDGFGGTGRDLAGLVDATGTFLDEAQTEIEATTSLIGTLEPVLETQQALSRDTLGYAAALADLTAEVVARDSDLRALLKDGPVGLDSVRRTVADLQPTLPLLLENLATNGRVLNTYIPELKQTLVVYPATIGRLQSTVNPRAAEGDVQLDLRATLNDPPSCLSGYLPVDQRRAPSQVTTRDVDRLAHCELPASSPTAVRGARNLPCPQSSARGPLPSSCGLTFESGKRANAFRRARRDEVVSTEQTIRAKELDVTSARRGDDAWMILVLDPLGLR